MAARILYVFGSKRLAKSWRAWDCLARTEKALRAKSCDKYGRVPPDCVVHTVFENYVPEEFLQIFYYEEETTKRGRK